MGELLKFLPHLVYPTIVGLSAFLGIYLLSMRRETLHEKYCNLVYSLTQSHPEDHDAVDDRYLVWTTRAIGGISIAVCVLMSVVTYLKYTS